MLRIAAKRSIAWAVASAAMAGVAMAIMLWSRAERDIGAAAAEAPSGNASPEARDPGNGTDPPPAAATTSVAVAEPAQELDHDTLWRLCPSLWGKFSDDCMAALEARYVDRPGQLRRFSMPPFPPGTPITWRQVYADPAATRRIVADALRNPQCRVAEGQVRLDLREVCAADAITRLAILQQQCGVILEDTTDSTAQWLRESALSRLENDASLDSDEYHRRRTEEDEGGFWGAWHVRKCRAAESTVTAWLPEFPAPPEDSDTRIHSGIYDQAKYLIPAAARRGSEWALARTLGSVAHINAMAELDLALAYAGRARKVGPESDLYLPYFIAAHHYAQLRGVQRHEMRLPVGGFTAEQWQAAWRKAPRIIAQGWEPMVDH